MDALREAVSRTGTQGALAHRAGLSQSTISDYLNARYSIGNMTLSVFLRLFSSMEIDFFGEKSIESNSDLLKEQLLEIFDSLSDKDKIRLITMAAANFGEKLREETKQP